MPLREEFLELATEYRIAAKIVYEDDSADEATKKKNLKKISKIAKTLHELYMNIVDEGQQWIFDEFMSHEDPHVRYTAANFGLQTNPQAAVRVLEAITELPSNSSAKVDAQIALFAWRKK